MELTSDGSRKCHNADCPLAATQKFLTSEGALYFCLIHMGQSAVLYSEMGWKYGVQDMTPDEMMPENE